jgi:hypothetical protein
LKDSKTRGLCSRHYKIWIRIGKEYDFVSQFVEEILIPIRRRVCNHPKTEANRLKRSDGYYRCRRCHYDEINERKKRKRRELKNE